MKDLSQTGFYASLTLISLGALGWGLATAGGQGLAFALFAVLTLGGSAVCIWERSIVRSAFSLMATFLGVAGIFVLLPVGTASGKGDNRKNFLLRLDAFHFSLPEIRKSVYIGIYFNFDYTG